MINRTYSPALIMSRTHHRREEPFVCGRKFTTPEPLRVLTVRTNACSQYSWFDWVLARVLLRKAEALFTKTRTVVNSSPSVK
jgi:hypothetical protein